MKKVYSKKNNNSSMNTDEKSQLKTRINHSVDMYIQKKRRIQVEMVLITLQQIHFQKEFIL